MALTRRALLRKTSLVLAGIGCSDLYLWKYGKRYQQVLAQPTGRKLALLVGVNQYRELDKASRLKGCLTDLELQRELLVHRFGFHPDDIVMLKNKQATLQNIETVFASHLIEQARPQDSVVFHFSGYGCLLRGLSDSVSESKLPFPGNILMPFDGYFNDSETDQRIENALLEGKLSTWFRSLNTQQHFCVIDAGFAYPGNTLLGNLRVRSLPGVLQQVNQPGALEQQEKLLNQSQRRQVLPGLVVEASQPSQTAVEARMRDFSAGLFTYALTQHLWQISSPKKFSVSFNRIVSNVEHQVGRVQQPRLRGQKHADFLPGLPLGDSADGVVTDIEENGEDVTVWLGGVLPQVMENYEAKTCFTVVSNEGVPSSTQFLAGTSAADTVSKVNSGTQELVIRLDSRRGCVGTGRCDQEGQLNAGQKVREAFRVMSKGVILNVALGSQLNRIERVDATSAFSDMPHINPAIAGEQNADVLFTQASSSSQVVVNSVSSEKSEEDDLQLPPPPQAQYGLFSQGGEELIDTRGEQGEAIKTAVNQLHDTLKLLLAKKMLDRTVNDFSSRLGAMVTLELVDAEKSQILSRQNTFRAPWNLKENSFDLSEFEKQGQMVQLPRGQHIQYRIHNYSDSPLYWLVMGIDNRTQFYTIYSPEALLAVPETETTSQDTVAPGESLTLPFAMNEYVVRGPEGLASTYVILSQSPFAKGLGEIASKIRQSSSNTSPVVVRLVNPLEVTEQVLQDLHDGSSQAAAAMGISSESNWIWNVDQWATFQFTYEVI